MISGAYDIQRLRAEEFPWTASSGKIYLNHAGTGPMPRRSIVALKEWAELRAEPWKIIDHETVFPALARVRAQCASLIGARAGEIALVPNTSTGLSAVARMLPLEPGDTVLTSDREFPSVVYAWRALGRSRDIHLRLVSTRGGWPDEEALLRALDDPRVRALTVSWVSFASGYRIDLARLGAACRERGIYFIVDAMQGLGCTTLDVAACQADFVACGGQKWLLSPYGTGFLYVREALIDRLEPPLVSWFIGPGSLDYTRLLDYDMRYFEDARRFEVPTLPAQDFIALGKSLELLMELGMEAVETHVRTLADRIVNWAEDRADINLLTPADAARRAGIVALAPPDPVEASQRLRAAGVVHSLRQGAIRFAPHGYNTLDEIDGVLRTLAGA